MIPCRSAGLKKKYTNAPIQAIQANLIVNIDNTKRIGQILNETRIEYIPSSSVVHELGRFVLVTLNIDSTKFIDKILNEKNQGILPSGV